MSDKIIKFPGAHAQQARESIPGPTPAPEPPSAAYGEAVVGLMKNLSEDQQKAIGLILAGKTFLLLAIEPTDRGADFFTALHGDHDQLRAAESHWPELIHNLYMRKGI